MRMSHPAIVRSLMIADFGIRVRISREGVNSNPTWSCKLVLQGQLQQTAGVLATTLRRSKSRGRNSRNGLRKVRVFCVDGGAVAPEK